MASYCAALCTVAQSKQTDFWLVPNRVLTLAELHRGWVTSGTSLNFPTSLKAGAGSDYLSGVVSIKITHTPKYSRI